MKCSDISYISLMTIAAIAVFGIIKFDSMAYSVLFLPSGLHDLMYLSLLSCVVVGEQAGRRLKYPSIMSSYIAFIFLSATLMQFVDFRPIGTEGEMSFFLDAAVYSTITAIFLMIVTYLIIEGHIRMASKIKVLYAVLITFLAGNLILTSLQLLDLFESYVMSYDSFVYLMLYAFVLSCYRVRPFAGNVVHNLSRLLYYRCVSLRQDKR